MNSKLKSFLNNNICKECKNFIDRLTISMPLFIKIVVCSTIILYLLNLILPFISLILSDIPYYTIYYFNIWRLITTPFMTTNILSIIFSLFFWFQDAVKLEKEIGTIKYMLIFFMNNICIQIIYCLITFLISLVIRNQCLLKMKITENRIRSEGLLPILLCDLTLLCLSNPENLMKFYFFPCTIKAKYYPTVLFVIFIVINGLRIDLEVLCGIGFGVLYHYYLGNKLKIGNNFSNKVENSYLFRWMKNIRGFIPLGGVGIPELKNNLENERNVAIHGSENSDNNQSGFQAFKGKGVVVGGDEKEGNTETDNNISQSDNEGNAGIGEKINFAESDSEVKP